MNYFTFFLLLFFILGIGNLLSLPSIIILLFSYLFVAIQIKNKNPLNPLVWLYLAWGFLYANTFSGIIKYKIIGNHLVKVTLISIVSIGIFTLGFYINKKKSPNRALINKYLINESNCENNIKIGRFFSWLSIIGLGMLSIEVFMNLRASIVDPAALRSSWNTRDSASFFGQLSPILFAGGLFSIMCFFLVNSQVILFLIGTISFALGSVFSAGRQQLFQVILISFLCLYLLHYFKVPFIINKQLKIILFGLILLAFSYFIFLSSERNKSDNDSRTMMEVFAEVNSFEYSDDFLNIAQKLPLSMNGLIADFSFYFSHELCSFAETLQFEKIPLINFDPLPLFPFIERQVDKLIPGKETQTERMRKNAERGFIGFLSSTTWKTSLLSLFRAFGYIGGLIIIFFHGLLSRIIFEKVMLNPSFVIINLAIANCIGLFYTIMYPIIGETSFLFYIVISIILLAIKRIH